MINIKGKNGPKKNKLCWGQYFKKLTNTENIKHKEKNEESQ